MIDHILSAMLVRLTSCNAIRRMLMLTAFLLVSVNATAQGNEQISWFVADLRGSIAPFGQNVALATSRGFEPSATPGTGLGLDAGANLYFYRWRVITFGVGATFHTSASNRAAEEDDVDPTSPTLRKKFTAISPQLSFNFGGRDGWSYLSGGIGSSRLSLFSRNGVEQEQRNTSTVNYGGGARWFVREHLALSLDLRFYALSPVDSTKTGPGSPRMTIMVFSLGASFK